LLQTFVDCMDLGGHGFSSKHKFSVRSIDETEYADGSSVTRILGGSSGTYKPFRNAFFTEQVQTDSTNDYYFRLTANGIGEKLDGGKTADYMLLRVVDSAGEYAVEEDFGGARVDNPTESMDKLNDALVQAEATIIVIPLVDLGRATFIGPLKGLISKLVNTNGEKPYRIVVAFTQYEKLFVRAGRDAFATASLRPVAQKVIQRAVEQGRWADDLRRFAEAPGRTVYFTVTSSYGFAKGLGIPNVDPHWRAPDGQPPSEQLFGKPDDIATFWRPFLTADPFISAAINQPGELTFTFESLFPEEKPLPGQDRRRSMNGTGKTADAPPPPPPPPPRPRNSILNWFNRQRD
jgi:hypothetical protein